MKDIMKYIKQQPLSCLLITIIWVICMVPVPETPLDDVKFIDKWTHLTMYGTLVLVIMAEYGHRKHLNARPQSDRLNGTTNFNPNLNANPNIDPNLGGFNIKRLLVGGLLAPIIMGGLVELAQAYLTNGVRSGDWLDFAANSCGALSGAIIGIPLARFLATRNKDA